MSRRAELTWAKAEIQKLVLDLAQEGMAIMFISSELEEVLRVSHRVTVLHDRKKVGEYSGDVDDQTIIYSMAGNL
jgi:galactofuranose transport system ATP-binding protein